ncbi:MAG TPA: amino acid adenylation domain-containing protein, partial [Thermoanaerobaculia bacterium]|nr:amino acid adenylation domain-containing protein [Thermoanaerobaculia bacterium]
FAASRVTVASSLRHPRDRQPDGACLLAALGRLWMAGVEIDWQGFYTHEQRRRVPLPTYPFERQRYWREPRRMATGGRRSAEPPPAGWFYAPWWRPSPRPAHSIEQGTPTVWLVFLDEHGVGSRLAARLRRGGCRVTAVRIGERFERLDEESYVLDPRRREDYEALIGHLRASDRLPERIVHAWNLVAAAPAQHLLERLEEARVRSFDSLLLLVQALEEGAAGRALRIGVLSNNLQKVAWESVLCPERALLLGAVAVIPQEHPNLQCQSIDLLAPDPGSGVDDNTIEEVVAELSTSSIRPGETVAAYRGGERWTRTFASVHLDAAGPATRFRQGGVYLITGGLGGLGLTLAEELAREVRAKLVLVGRSALPAREHWQKWLVLHRDDDEMSRRIRRIEALEALGAEVLPLAANVADAMAMAAALEHAERRFGPVHGVIHAAGIPGGGLIQQTRPEAAARTFEPKVQGTLVLHSLFEERELDFFTVCSSVASFLGGFGHADYCAANAFCDAFAQASPRRGARLIAIGWDRWDKVGMAARRSLPVPGGTGERGISPRQGGEAFRRILQAGGAPQIAVSPRDLPALLEQRELPALLRPAASPERPEIPGAAHAPARDAYVAPTGALELQVAEIWQQVLGVERVSAADSFFELGGHSLLALQLMARLRHVFGVSLELDALFGSPTVAGVARWVEATLGKGGVGETAPIPRVPRDGELPLSFAQQRLWLFDCMEPGSPAYNIANALRLSGALDLPVLAASLSEIVRRHEALRTRFEQVEGEPRQIVAPPSPVALPMVDLEGLRAPRHEVQRLIQAQARQPFDLSRGPLLRVLLLRLGTREHVALFTMHHIVADGWSMIVLVRELTALYTALVAGRPSPLPELPIQYVDFAAWQRRGPEAGLEERLAVWRERLADAPPLLELPGDRPREAWQGFAGATLPISLSAQVDEDLHRVSRRCNCTPFVVLLAAFAVFLRRCSGRDDLVLGTDDLGRDRTEVEGLIGFFVNQLVLRFDLSQGGTGVDLLARVRDVVVAAHAHRNLPFQKLIEALRPERGADRTPLFQVMFSLFDAAAVPPRLPGVDCTFEEVATGTAKFDLLFALVRGETGLHGTAEYRTSLFDRTTVRRWIGHFQTLLDALLADLERPWEELPWLTAAEHHQLTVEWNDVEQPLPALTASDLFPQQARLRPDAVAAGCGEVQISFGELAARVAATAWKLRRQGIETGAVVGLLAGRDLPFLEVMLAIFEAGGVHLPLDPAHPPHRLRLILMSSSLRCIVCADEFAGRVTEALTALPPARRPAVCSLAELTRGAGGGPVSRGPSLADPAYVFYTSGSTGAPKGAVLQHLGMLNHLTAKVRDLALGPRDVLVQNASQCFDVSIFQFLATLLVGGSVAIAPDETAHDPAQLLDFVEQRGVTIWETVPSLLRVLLDEIDRRGSGRPPLAALRWLIVMGETLPPDLCRRWLANYPGVPLLNAWGATECSDDVTHHPIVQPPAGLAPVSIGHPIANLRVYVLDAALRPVPIGIPGELYIGGIGVGSGYLAEPQRTAEAFIPGPFEAQPGARQYRTGDLGRWLPGRRLEFLGRVDHQVKLHGLRIELGEIEAVLREHPALADAAVVVHQGVPGGARLVAYCVAAGAPARDGDDALDGIDGEQVAQWRTVFDEIYQQDARTTGDPGVNPRVWIDSYTGAQLPADQIAECVDDSVARILALQPRRVLEIGCGTGLLLMRIAPYCETYWGTDLSPEVIRDLERRVRDHWAERPEIRLFARSAEDLEGIPAGAFDLVVLNEVVQYFPSLSYLARVLERAMDKVVPGGHVFVGGVRNYELLEAFHASVQLRHAADAIPVTWLRRRVRTQMSREKELLVAPGFFTALHTRLPGIAAVGIQLKGGRSHNELTKFRYDAVLRIGPEAPEEVDAHWLDWQRDGLGLAGLRRLLREEGPEALGIAGIPNARLGEEAGLLEALGNQGAPAAAGALRDLLRLTAEAARGVEPADLWALGDELAYQVDLVWSEAGCDRFDALLRRPDPRAVPGVPRHRVHLRPLTAYGNSPAQGFSSERLVPALRLFLASRLPKYMLPAAFVLLDELPLTPNGKLDRRALPAPEETSASTGPADGHPRTPFEETLVACFAGLLQLDGVGIHDDFFELGGHSLLATQLISRVRSDLGVELRLREIFDHPTVAGLASAVAEALRVGETAEAPPLVPEPRGTDRLPLSFAQERLWFLEQLEPGGAAYNVSATLRLRGRLEVGALSGALGAVVGRHESLRTVFPADQGQPWQEIIPPMRLPLPMVDLSILAGGAEEREARHWAGEHGRRAFDLARGPLVRTCLLRLAPAEHWLLCSMHHIVSDGWSMGVMVREVAELYGAALAGRPPALPQLAVQYADYALWQRRWMSREVLDRELDYWREQLAGAPGELAVPGDRSRPQVASRRGGRVPFAFEAHGSDVLRRVGRSQGATLFMVLLSAWVALLSRWSGQDDLCIGTPVAGRDRTETEGLIGFLVNTLVMRLRPEPDASFGELVRQARGVVLGAHAHQALPFEKLVEALRPQRSLGHAPLFQVLFVLQKPVLRELALPGLEPALEPVDLGATQFDLVLSIDDDGGALTGTLGFGTDLFEPVTAVRMVEHLRTLLLDLATGLEAPIGSLRWFTEAEEHALLWEWNDSAENYGDDGTAALHELVTRGAGERADAVAVEEGPLQVTYGELVRRVDALAVRLRPLAGVERVVGVCLPRSVEQVVAMLGALAAGCAYLPIEPGAPPQRLARMLAATGGPWIVTRRPWRAELEAAGGRVFCLDEAVLRQEEHPATQEETPGQAGTLAYVLYTSGSTGRPKGVMVPLRGIVNRLLWMRSRFGMDGRDRVLQKTSSTFDASIWEIFLPLAVGARLILAEPGREADAHSLVRMLHEHRITVLQLVPSMLQVLLDATGLAGCALSRLFCGGEALPQDLVERFTGRCDAELINLYGPTEASIDATFWSCSLRGDGSIAPLGRPLSNVKVFVLGPDLRPVAPGVVGEIAIGGAGLARGYLGRPDWTAASFIPDPCGGERGERLYRTGDLGRRRGDGLLEYLGRRDAQVKLRGVRIEPGEVEAALREHPAIQDSVVICREVLAGRPHLVAYVVPRIEMAPAGAELREFLLHRIPESMVPWVFVVLPGLPRLPSGKVDRSALPAPEARETGAEAQRPRGWLEELVAGVWEEVLGVEQVTATESFFELGGHSLLAIQVVSRLRAATGVELELRALFEAPTVARLARWIEEALARGERDERPALARLSHGGSAPLSFAQERLWFFQQLEPAGAAYNQPVALLATGRLAPQALAASLGELMRRHEVLRSAFVEIAGEVRQVVTPLRPDLPCVDLQALPAPLRVLEQQRLRREEARRPFDLARGPVVRTTLVRLGETEHVLLLTLHHIASDGWSRSVMVREISALYPALAAGETLGMPELPFQYADFAAWQRRWLNTERLSRLLAYWRGQLAGAPPALELPTDHPRSSMLLSRGGRMPVALGKPTSEGARRLAREHGATIFMTMLAAFEVLLHRLSGEQDLVVGIPVANRDQPEIEGLIGLFVNSLALRTRVEGCASLTDLLQRVRATVLAAAAHQDLPFEKLVEDLQPAREIVRSPVFQVMFAFDEWSSVESLALPGLTLSVLDDAPTAAIFDLGLDLAHGPAGLEGALEYRADLFDRTTAARMAAQFRTLVEAAVAQPDVGIEDLPLWSTAERHQLLFEWSGAAAVPPRGDRPLLAPFEERAGAAADRVAILAGEAALTYGELAGRARRLAAHLRGLDVGLEVQVGIFLERSPEQILTLLAVLQAGGAYVPLDPAYPQGRLELALRRGDVPVVVTREGLRAQLPPCGATVVAVDRIDLAVASRTLGEDESSFVDEAQLAYVIYTSGSTGRPKGVGVSLGAAGRFVRVVAELFALQSEDRVLQFSSLSFDASVEEILPALVSGATLVLRDPEIWDAETLWRRAREQAITVLDSATAYWHEIARESPARPEWVAASPLRLVVFGGEAARPELVAAWQTGATKHIPLLNGYGITETTVASIFTFLEAGRVEGDAGWETIPIGRPLANAVAYILDPRGRPVLPGLPGELAIGGSSLARGYLGVPELTAEKFVPDPFSQTAGARLYRTGDLARFRPDGRLEFLGRGDRQIKVRGFRV